MKWVLIILGVLAVVAVIGVVYVRLASHDPVRWHVDPATVTEVRERNQYLGDVVIEDTPQAVAGALDDLLLGETFNAERLAGDITESWATYVVKTPLIGYPDYISARVSDADGAARVQLYSRSRFGDSDLGANKARVERIFSVLKDG